MSVSTEQKEISSGISLPCSVVVPADTLDL